MPSSKERSGRWVGLAHGIGDSLTFWILDDQSKHILAQSVVHPYTQNLRVKWDPTLIEHTVPNAKSKKGTKEYVNMGLDTSILAMSKTKGPMTRAQGRLQLDNDVLPIDDTIESYPRTKKVPYNQVEYKEKYTPPEFKDPIPPVRCSERINPTKDRPLTRWTAAKTRKAQKVNGDLVFVPSSI